MKKLIIIGVLLMGLALQGLAQTDVITPGMNGLQTRNALNTAFSELLGVVDTIDETIRIGGVQINASAAEVDILNGALVNVTELNRLVGLPGNIVTLLAGKENSLGNPGTSGYVLSSTTAGVRSWIAPGGGVNYPSGSGIPLVVSGASWGTTITDNSANWNTAYGWGNHASAGYAPTNNATFTGTHTIPLPCTVGTTSVTAVENYPTENYGTTGMGDVVFSIGATITSPNITNAPVATGTVVAGTGITAAMLSRFMYFNTAAAIDITADPQIANGTSGQLITIIGSSDTNTLTLDDATGLRLTGQMVLGIGDNITLLYEGTIGDWIEISRSNN